MCRTSSEQALHDIVASEIASQRFGLSGWFVQVNPDEDSEPDITATASGQLVASGEIETRSTITDDEAAEWKKFGDRCPRFYLFIPAGTEDKAIELIEKHKVVCAGLRCYSNDTNGLSVSSVYFPNGRSPEDSHPWWMNLGKE